MNPADTPETVVDELLPLVRELCAGAYGIALGGSFAKGDADPLSDVDLYLFAHDVLPRNERDRRITAALGRDARVESWGRDEPFVQAGTDFWLRERRVEVWLRSPAEIDRTLAAAHAGDIERGYVAWTVMGFFNYVLLADLHAMRVVEDPDGRLARWKEGVERYPERLRRNIIQRFMAEASFWPENFHYRTAVERGDVFYTSGIVQQVMHSLVQVLFALNGRYFPGEKKLLAALDRLPLKPAELEPRLRRLLAPGAADPAALHAQRRELAALVAEVAALVQAS